MIERIAAGGDGVGRLPDGMTVFVPRTAPGDTVELEVVQKKPRYARARLRAVLAPGPARVTPPCRHYLNDGCGGCQLQHLTPEAQRAAKRRIVGDALRRIGKRDAADPEIVPSPEQWRYRHKISLVARGARIGLHAFDDRSSVFDLEDCPITSEPLMELWRLVSGRRTLLPKGLRSVVLREDLSGGRHVVVEAEADRPWDATPLARAIGLPEVTYWWRPATGAARAVAGPASGFPVLAFEQVNPVFASRIREAAVDALGDVTGLTAWDLYAGVGDAARLLAERGAAAWAVEADRAAVEWAERHTTGIRWIIGRVEESLHRLRAPDVVLANPPRAGMAERVTARLDRWARERPGARLVYVSCDPATLARDLARMPAFALRRVTAYDLFPQTSHVETLVVLEAR